MRRLLAIATLGLGLLQISARGDEPLTARTCADPELASSALAGRAVSFRRDVAPVLRASCSTASCHGGGSRPPVLDPTADVSLLRKALVGVASEQRPGNAYVEPGKPQASYLVQKVEGCLVDAECTDHDCGASMPFASPPLSVEAQATLRMWIAQGANDN